MQFSIVMFSDLFSHEDYRWDSEYLCFAPYKNQNVEYVPIEKILLSSQYGLSIEMNDEGIGTPIYRMNEISNMLCKQNILKYAQISLEEIENYRLNDRDVLFNRTNSQVFVGRTGIFRKFSENPKVFASYLVRIIPDPNLVNPEYLTIFLNTKYGMIDVKRRARVSINQSNVNAEELKRVEIPLFTLSFQSKISRNFDNSFEINKESSILYNQAQELLLTELGLNDWQPKHKLTFVKNYSEIQNAKRMDAEYFQPKYDDIINAITSYKGGWDTLENIVNIKKCIEVGSDEYEEKGIPFVRVSNLHPFEITEEKYISKSLYSQIKQYQPKKGEILLSKDATPGIAYYMDDTPPKCIPSGGILRLKTKQNIVNNEYLTAILNSVLTKEQVNRDVGGSVILHWRPEQVKKTIIPILSPSKQEEIQKKISESFALRKKSKQLLENAKKAIEMAIEHSEKKAMQWLKSQ